jgi:hypothetical protein
MLIKTSPLKFQVVLIIVEDHILTVHISKSRDSALCVRLNTRNANTEVQHGYEF